MLYNTKILETALNALFHNSYMSMLSRPDFQAMNALFTVVNSTTGKEDYAWLGDVPLIKEWIGNKEIGSILDYDYTIKNKDWSAGFGIDRNELEDGGTPIAADSRVAALAMAAAKHRYELVIDLIINGTSNLAYDGQAFFASRTEHSGVNDNLLAGTGTSLAQIKADITSARTAMMRFVSDAGRTLGLRGDTIVCPPELEATMLEAVRAASLVTSGSGTTYNPVSQWIRNVVAVPELSDTTDWYLFSTDMPVKPFIYQSRKAPTPVLDDTTTRKDRKIEYSVEMRDNAGYGFYQMGVKVVNS